MKYIIFYLFLSSLTLAFIPETSNCPQKGIYTLPKQYKPRILSKPVREEDLVNNFLNPPRYRCGGHNSVKFINTAYILRFITESSLSFSGKTFQAYLPLQISRSLRYL